MAMFMTMNRELRRVPLDFDWPLDKVWCGYHMIPYDYAAKQKYDSSDPWVEYVISERISVEPPTGEGYQCWETTSEGSPITPVFKTFDELCEWLGTHPRGITRDMTIEDWKKALSDNYGLIDIGTGKMA